MASLTFPIHLHLNPLHSYFVSSNDSFFAIHDLKSDDTSMSGTGCNAPGSDMGSFSSASKCISSNELLSTATAKQGNGKRPSNRISVIKLYIFAEVSS